MVCKLCRKEHNEKVGAHLITESVIRKAVSEDGTKGRDKELLATISINHLGKKFVGRNASVEGIKNLLGKDITDEDLVLNDNPLVDYELVCLQCEKSFNQIESTFINNVLPNISIIPESRYREINSNAYKIFLLFVLLNIWRTAVTSKHEITLNSEFLEKLRILLNSFKENQYNKILDSIDLNDPSFPKIDFTLFYVEDSNISSSANSILIDFTKIARTMLINNLLIVWFNDYTSNYRIPYILTDLTSKTKINKLIKASGNVLPVQYITGSKSTHLRTNIFEKQLRDYKEYFAKVFNTNFKRLFGINATKNSLNYFKYRIDQYFMNRGALELDSIYNEMKSILLKCYQVYHKHGRFD